MGLFKKKASKKKISWIKKALLVNKVAWAGVKQAVKKVAPKTYAKVQTVVNTAVKNSEVRKAAREYKTEVRQQAREEKKKVNQKRDEAIKNARSEEEEDAIREAAENERNKIDEAKRQVNDIIEQNKDEEILKNKSNRDEIVEKISEAETEEEIDEAKADIADQVIRQLELVTNDGRDKEIEIILDTTGKQKDVWLQEAALEVSYYLENSDFGADGFGTPDIDLEMESEFSNFLTGMRDFSEDTFNEHRGPNSTFILVDGPEKSESIYAGVPPQYRNQLAVRDMNKYPGVPTEHREDLIELSRKGGVLKELPLWTRGKFSYHYIPQGDYPGYPDYNISELPFGINSKGNIGTMGNSGCPGAATINALQPHVGHTVFKGLTDYEMMKLASDYFEGVKNSSIGVTELAEFVEAVTHGEVSTSILTDPQKVHEAVQDGATFVKLMGNNHKLFTDGKHWLAGMYENIDGTIHVNNTNEKGAAAQLADESDYTMETIHGHRWGDEYLVINTNNPN